MNIFQERLKAKLIEKKKALLELKKLKSKTSLETELESETSSKPTSTPPLDYSTSKVLRHLKDFEEDRQKKKKKAFKETPLSVV